MKFFRSLLKAKFGAKILFVTMIIFANLTFTGINKAFSALYIHPDDVSDFREGDEIKVDEIISGGGGLGFEFLHI